MDAIEQIILSIESSFKNFNYEEFIESDDLVKQFYVERQINQWNFVGYPNIFEFIDKIVNKNELIHDSLLYKLYFDLSLIYQNTINIPKVKELEEKVLHDPQFNFIDDLLNHINTLKALKETNTIDFDHLKFILCILSNNNLRKQTVPLFSFFIDCLDLKQYDVDSLLYTIEDECIKTESDTDNKELAFDFFLFWLSKKYKYALFILHIMELRNEKLFHQDIYQKDIQEFTENIQNKLENQSPSLKALIQDIYDHANINIPTDFKESMKALISFMLKTNQENTFSDEEIVLALFLIEALQKIKEDQNVKECNSQPIEEPKKVTYLRKEIKELKKEIKAFDEVKCSFNDNLKQKEDRLQELNNQIKEMEKKQILEIKKYKNKIKDLEERIEENKEYRTELIKLREFTYFQSLENEFIEDEQNDLKFKQFVQNKKILLFGGHIKMLEKMKKKYPEIDILEIMDNASFNDSSVKKYDCICISTRFLNHGAYFRLMNACNRYNIDYMYLGNENINKIEADILQHYLKKEASM